MNIKETFQIDINGNQQMPAEALLATCATETGYIGYKTVNDSNDNPIPVMVEEKDENDNIVYLEDGVTPIMVQKKDINGQAVYETVTVTVSEHISVLVKDYIMSIVDVVTKNLETKNGTLHYNAKQMKDIISSMVTVKKL